MLATTVLVPFLAVFRQLYPGIKLQFLDMAEQDLEQALVDEEIDLGIGTSTGTHREISCTPLFTDTYLAVLPAAHPLARKRQIAWEMLSREPLIALSPHSPLRQQLDTHFTQLGVVPTFAFEVSFPTTVFSMVRHDMGMSVLPANAQLLADAKGLEFRKLGPPSLRRTVGVFQLTRRSLSPATTILLESLMDYVKEHREVLG
ncbi:hypothetical protein CNECB9_5450010 [Cupriavidus necator]|uniref:LysR substrate-binding domain-containing protein n=1 Tax=Cupriavidus necator TaxID=106590 RepID=A0A1K0IR28_CUPNE|nr:hypothetical protein CNECB9_5450010 [Cupriavidus necator]